MPPQVQLTRRRLWPSLSLFLHPCPRAQLSACCFELSHWLWLRCSLLLTLFMRNRKCLPPNALSLTLLTASVPPKACPLCTGTPHSQLLRANTLLAWRRATFYRINFQVNHRFKSAPLRLVRASPPSPRILLSLRTPQPFIRPGCSHRIIAKIFWIR